MHYRMMNKKMYEQNTPQARFFLWDKIRRMQVLSNKNALQAWFFDQILMNGLSNWCKM